MPFSGCVAAEVTRDHVTYCPTTTTGIYRDHISHDGNEVPMKAHDEFDFVLKISFLLIVASAEIG